MIQNMMSVGSEIKHIFLDHDSNQIKTFEKDSLENELDRIAKSLEIHFEKLEKIGSYELGSIQVSIGVEGDFLVIGLNGGVTLIEKIKFIENLSANL
jgi:hypothetical protein